MCGIIDTSVVVLPAAADYRVAAARVPRLRLRGDRAARADGLVRAFGNLQFLRDAAESNTSGSTTGLGHTRWATHGGVTELNAHPLTACDDNDLAIVLNGIVENFRELREELTAGGHTLSSETDAEVVAHLLEDAYDGDLVAAVRAVYQRLEGHFTFVVIHKDHPNHLWACGTRRRWWWESARARCSSPRTSPPSTSPDPPGQVPG
jgi:glutamine phosphoribosylpyrophosphate amidotransferase